MHFCKTGIFLFILSVMAVHAIPGMGALGSAEVYTIGSSEPTVCRIQQTLSMAVIDCNYGSETAEAVRAFQESKKLQIDGIAGPQTLEALGLTDQALGRVGIVTTTRGIGVNLRTCPSQNCSITYNAPEEMWLELTETTPVSADGYTWRQVPDGSWVAAEYLRSLTPVSYEPDPATQPPPDDNQLFSVGQVKTSNGAGVNVRTCPRLSCAIAYDAPDGIWLEMADATPITADGYTWRQVADGHWVVAQYLKPVPPAQ